MNKNHLSELQCPFCLLSDGIEVICENELARAIYDIFPISQGHALIIPTRHFTNFFEITKEEYLAVFELIKKVKSILDEKYNPEGYNIGVNVNDAAGQTIPHVHIHLIPRFKGDVENPIGGVRNVIPSKGDYSKLL
jgi:diadenosine tetraphosphate (Ap4A) HIT family hydrolase